MELNILISINKLVILTKLIHTDQMAQNQCEGTRLNALLRLRYPPLHICVILGSQTGVNPLLMIQAGVSAPTHHPN